MIAAFDDNFLLSGAEGLRVSACKIDTSCFGKMSFIELSSSTANRILTSIYKKFSIDTNSFILCFEDEANAVFYGPIH